MAADLDGQMVVWMGTKLADAWVVWWDVMLVDKRVDLSVGK